MSEYIDRWGLRKALQIIDKKLKYLNWFSEVIQQPERNESENK